VMEHNLDKKKYIYLLIPVIFWLVIIVSSLTWNIKTGQEGMEQTILNIGRSFFKEIDTTRLWNSKHGGVYVPITDETIPNPYLDVANRDVTTSAGINLTKINPSYMTRQISEIAKQESNIQYHLTSLQPMHPANKAAGWEATALNEFASGEKEVFQFIRKTLAYRYMAPLRVKESCLTCHAKQGYKLGDIRGGISVTIPANAYIAASQRSKNSLIVIHLFALVFGLSLFYFLTKYRDEQELQIRQKNIELEKEIVDRKVAEAEKEKLETQLRQANKMEAIGTMAGGIAYHFNNILGSVLGFADMAKDEIPKESIAYQDIEKVLTSANRAKELTQRIMIFSQQKNSQERRCHPSSVLDKFIHSVENTCENISIEKDIDANVGDISIDHFEFEKILVNLYNNAVDAMKMGGGILRICLTGVEIERGDFCKKLNVTAGLFVHLMVSDTGIGIETENVQRIFDPFFTTKEVGQGDGIGLSVVRGIVTKNGGGIQVESEVGKGSEFHVFLPVAEMILDE